MRDNIAREATDPRVAALLAAAAAPAERPVPGEAEALEAFRLAMSSPADHPRRRMQSRTTVKLAAAASLSALSLVGGGYAVAATGALPGAAQQVARDALGTVGVTVPGPADQAAEASATRGSSAEAKAAAEAKQAEATARATATTTANAHGKAVSGLATSTTLTGAEKGAAISDLASGGKSHTGDEKKQAAATATSTPTPTETTTTEPTDGSTTGDEASGGASTAGSGNADTRKP